MMTAVCCQADLGHAYIEIGEHDSAVELLQDIIDNGDEQQIARGPSCFSQYIWLIVLLTK